MVFWGPNSIGSVYGPSEALQESLDITTRSQNGWTENSQTKHFERLVEGGAGAGPGPGISGFAAQLFRF